MSKHLERDLDRLKKELLVMGGMVEEATDLAISAIVDRRKDLAEQVTAGDDKIDAKELEIEDECLKVLALHQLVASDLRFLITVLKVNSDLERMGDLAKNIAERARARGAAADPGARDLGAMAERSAAWCTSASTRWSSARRPREEGLHRRPRGRRGEPEALHAAPAGDGEGHRHDRARRPPALRVAPPRAHRRPRDQHRRTSSSSSTAK